MIALVQVLDGAFTCLAQLLAGLLEFWIAAADLESAD
jgi:hypothetical protein